MPTCYFLATSAKCTKEYEGDYRWMIELEKGWSAWMPGNEPYYGNTDLPMKYRLGRYDFEVHFESDKSGTQTNLTTGKVRRVQKIMRGEPLPAWEAGCGGQRGVCKEGLCWVCQVCCVINGLCCPGGCGMFGVLTKRGGMGWGCSSVFGQGVLPKRARLPGHRHPPAHG